MVHFLYILLGIVIGVGMMLTYDRTFGKKLEIKSPLPPPEKIPEPTPAPIVLKKEEPTPPPVVEKPRQLTMQERLNARYEFADVKIWKGDGSSKAILIWKNAIGKRMQATLNSWFDYNQACRLIEDSLHDLKVQRVK